MSLLLVITILAVFLATAMAVAWRIVLVTGKSGWTDVFWSASVGISGVGAALLPIEGANSGPRAWVVALLVGVWSLRLATHIARRTIRGGDDPRYAELRRGWGENYRSQLLLFLEVQAAVALILAIALLAAAHNPAPFGIGDLAGIVVAVTAIAGEAISDRQLARFSADPANKGKVCDTGLWALSRHPNYFFEWLYWMAYVPIGLGHAWGWGAVAAPLLMYLLLRHVSGVPPLEGHMLRSRGDAYIAYQRRVPAFWPIGAKR